MAEIQQQLASELYDAQKAQMQTRQVVEAAKDSKTTLFTQIPGVPFRVYKSESLKEKWSSPSKVNLS